jgi:hypothetical protein
MKRIIIRLGEQAPDSCAWIKIEADGAMAAGQGSLAELAAGAEGYRLQVLIPGSEVLLTRVVLPPGTAAARSAMSCTVVCTVALLWTIGTGSVPVSAAAGGSALIFLSAMRHLTECRGK